MLSGRGCGHGRGHERCRQTLASLADDFGQVRPGGNAALAAGLDNAGEQGEGTGALGGARAHADATGDDPVAQGALSLVVAQRQLGMVEHHQDRCPSR